MFFCLVEKLSTCIMEYIFECTNHNNSVLSCSEVGIGRCWFRAVIRVFRILNINFRCIVPWTLLILNENQCVVWDLGAMVAQTDTRVKIIIPFFKRNKALPN